MKKLDKDALLEEAKRRYPVGTKFKVVHSPEAIRKVTSHEKHDDTFVQASDGLHINFISDLIEGGKSSCISASVYFNGKWAEIVEEPKVEAKFEKGKWYELKYNFKYKLCNIIGKSIENSTNILYFNKYYNIIKGKWSEADSLSLDKDISLIYSKELSLQEIQQYLPDGHLDKFTTPIAKEEFVLPEKWCIKSTDEADETLIKWRDGEYTIRPAYLCSDKYWINEDDSKAYTEITFDQFKKYILKEKVKEEVKSMEAAYEAQFKKDEDYKVGDYVITKGFGSNYDGRILKIRKIEQDKYCYFEVFDGGYFGKEHNFSITNILRKALPHEIPVENSVKQYPYTPEESIKLDFEVKWEEPRYIGGVDSITATGWGIYEQMKKQPIQSRKTPDLIDKSKVEVKIKRTKVKQIKL